MVNTKITIVPYDPNNELKILPQNEANSSQIGTHAVVMFPLCARYTIAVAADTPEVRSTSINYIYTSHTLKNIHIRY